MKQLTCEMCGGTDLIKQDGVFVCQNCGTKYSVEEARKMMVEGVVEVTGTVKVDNSAAVENYLKMAQNALEASNHAEAENYANKIIELDPQNSAAWLIKGEAAGWQSKANNNRLGESVTAWLNAIEYASDEELTKTRETIAGNYSSLFVATINLHSGHFANIQSDANLQSTLNALKDGISMMNTLMEKGGVSFNRGPIYSKIVIQLNSAACDGFKDAKKDFGPELRNMATWQWKNFTSSCDNCITLLEKALDFCYENSTGTTICNNLVLIATEARDSCSWKFNVNAAGNYSVDYCFTKEAKETRTKAINRFNERKKFYMNDHVTAILNDVQGSRKTEELARGRDVYWQEHAEERAQLEGERSRLQRDISELTQQMHSLPISAACSEAENEIELPNAQMKSISIFKIKEKMAMGERIKQQKEFAQAQRQQEAAEKKPYEDRIEAKRARIGEINREFVRDRGQVSAPNDTLHYPDAIVDGKFNMTVRQLAEHISKNLPSSEYAFKSIMPDIFGLGFPDLGHQFFIGFERPGVDEKHNNIPATIYCVAQSEDSPIQAVLLSENTPTKQEDVHKEYVVIGGRLLTALFDDISLSEAEKRVAEMYFNKDRTLWRQGDMRYETADRFRTLGGHISIHSHAIIIRPVNDR